MLLCCHLSLFEDQSEVLKGKNTPCYFPISFDFRGRLYFHSPIGPSYFPMSRYMFEGSGYTPDEVLKVIYKSRQSSSYGLLKKHTKGVYNKVSGLLSKHAESIKCLNKNADLIKFQNYYSTSRPFNDKLLKSNQLL
jgi:hypothetical protein